jgi:hypothetical protein
MIEDSVGTVRFNFSMLRSYMYGFVKNVYAINLGPNCKNRHVKKLICQNYLFGFCPDGPNCKLKQ